MRALGRALNTIFFLMMPTTWQAWKTSLRPIQRHVFQEVYSEARQSVKIMLFKLNHKSAFELRIDHLVSQRL